MFPSPFAYARPPSLPQALSLLAEHPDTAKVLAGGQSLLPLMKLRLAAPESLIDLGLLDDLRYVRVEGGDLAIGALTRFHDLERSAMVRDRCPALAHVASLVGDPQVRHRGTIGGTLAHADPASDLPTLLLALDAAVVITSVRGSRSVTGRELFEGFMTTVLAEDEILTEVRVPIRRQSWAYQKFTRRGPEWAVVAVAAVRDDRDGQVRVALANVGSTPLRAPSVEAGLADGVALSAAALLVLHDISPFADAVATVPHRQQLAVTLVERSLRKLDGGTADE